MIFDNHEIPCALRYPLPDDHYPGGGLYLTLCFVSHSSALASRRKFISYLTASNYEMTRYHDEQ